MKRITFLSVLAVLVFGFSFAFAQSDSARIVGTVTDASGASVQGATVTVTNQATGRVLTATTGTTGNYQISALNPGRYQVVAKQTNFKTTMADVTLEVSQVQEINFKLQPGSVETTVNVSDEVPLVETSTSSTGDVIQGRQVTELPLNGRNFTQLALLTPGVTRGAYGDAAMGGRDGTSSETFRNSETGGAALSANGLRPQANNFILDGVDNNESLVNSIVFFPPAEAIQEFRVNTSVAPAEFGRAGGAVVQTSIKSGSNQIHGSAFEFRRTDPLDAVPYGYDKKPPFKLNQFGGTLGAPIWKNKLFAFVDYQGRRQSQPQAVEYATVPTAKMRTGDFSELLGTSYPTTPRRELCPNLYIADPQNAGKYIVSSDFSGKGYIYNPTTCLPFGWNGVTKTATNIIPSNMLNAAAMKYLAAFPNANINGKLQQNFRAQRQSIRNFDDYDARIDFYATQKDSVFARYSYGQDNFTVTNRLQDSDHSLPSGWGSGSNFNHPRGVAAGYTHTFNDSLINEFRFGYTRPFYGYNPPNASQAMGTAMGIVNANRNSLLGGMPLIGGWNSEIEYVGDGGPYTVPQKSFQFLDSLTYNIGRHSFKVGANIIRRQVDFIQGNNAKGYFYIGDGTGNFTGYEVSELLAGFVGRYQIGQADTYYKTRNWETGYFLQDDFRVNSKLTLNLGLRYDLFTWPTEVNNRQSNFDLATGKLIEPGTANWPASLVNTDRNNFAPRVGFAYDMFGTSKTVVRGGYGMFYFLDRGGVGKQLSNNPEFNGTSSYQACPTADCSTGYRITFSGMAPIGSTDPTQATAALPSANVQVDLNNPTNVDVVSYPKNSQNSAIQQWNLQIEQALDNNTSFDVAYVGTKMDHLATAYNANAVPLGAATSSTKLFPNLGAINVYGFIGTGTYNGLQTRLTRRLSNHLQYNLAYTWSHTIDNSNGSFSSSAGNIFVDNKGNPLLKYNKANSDNDIRHFFVASALYELPWGKGRTWLGNAPKAVDLLVGGWQLNNILTLSSGSPFNVSINGAPGNRPDYSGGCQTNVSKGVWLVCTPGAFTAPPTVNDVPSTQNGVYTRPGSLARNYFYGPGLHTWDMSMFKEIGITERIKTQFRFEVFNLTNSLQFQNPDGNLQNLTLTNGTWTTSNKDNFGLTKQTRIGSEREVQFALRVTF